jgi:LysM repeat protein
MKKELVSLILAGFLLFTLPSVGQNTKYPTKKVNGIEYYIYTVQVSEGLFAIGRKFDLAPDDIAKANPYIKNGLKAGEEILIPVHHSSEKKAQAETKSTPKFIEHKVAKKQTLFAISRLYNVSQEDIVKYNPIVQNGFKEGLILKIPVAVKDTKPAAAKETIQVVAKDTKAAVSKETKPLVAEKAKPAASQLRTHIVKPNETLFSISKRYNVEIKDVVKLNPGAEKTIEVGSELKIPALVTKKSRKH